MVNLVNTYLTRGREDPVWVWQTCRDRTRWCHLSAIPGTRGLVSTEGNGNFLGTSLRVRIHKQRLVLTSATVFMYCSKAMNCRSACRSEVSASGSWLGSIFIGFSLDFRLWEGPHIPGKGKRLSIRVRGPNVASGHTVCEPGDKEICFNVFHL